MKYLEYKIATRIDDIEKIRKGEFPAPRSLTIYPSEVCNLHCIGCHSKKIHKVKGFMSYKLFKVILDDFIKFGGKAIALEGGGEPMLTPDIDKMLKYAKGKVDIGIITNGTVFKKEMLLANWIRVSMPATTKLKYNKLTVSDKYDTVINNIKTIVKKRKDTKIGIKLLLSEICPSFPNARRQLPTVDYITEKRLRNDKHSLVKNPKHVDPCGLTPLRAVVDFNGSFYACPFFHHIDGTYIGIGEISKFWGLATHRKAIKSIKNCNLYDCPMLDIDYAFVKGLDLNFI